MNLPDYIFRVELDKGAGGWWACAVNGQPTRQICPTIAEAVQAAVDEWKIIGKEEDDE